MTVTWKKGDHTLVINSEELYIKRRESIWKYELEITKWNSKNISASNSKRLRHKITHFQNNGGDLYREHFLPFSLLSFGPYVVDTYLGSQAAKELQENMDKFVTTNMKHRRKGFIEGDLAQNLPLWSKDLINSNMSSPKMFSAPFKNHYVNHATNHCSQSDYR